MTGRLTSAHSRRGRAGGYAWSVSLAMALLVACQAPTPVATPTLETTRTPTRVPASPTVRVEPRPTWTATVTSTSRPTPTATLPPTLTPAPAPTGDGSGWRLVPWTAERVDDLLAQTASQLQALQDDPLYGSVYGGEILQTMYGNLVLAEQEALLRFPNSPQAERWRWDLAYHQSIAFTLPASDQAPELSAYAALLSDALNTRGLTFEQLPAWFASHESRVDLTVTPLDPARPVEASALGVIDGMAYFWMARRAGAYDVVGLQSNLFYFREAASGFHRVDLTGDSQPEIVLSYSASTCCGFYTEHFVYDVASGHPVLLAFIGPGVVNGRLTRIGDSSIEPFASTGTGEPAEIRFDATYGDPFLDPCSVHSIDRYQWTGREFVWAATTYALLPSSQYDDALLCSQLRALAHDDEETSVIAQAAANMTQFGKEEVRLRARFRLAEYQVRAGHGEAAQSTLEDLMSLPASQQSEVDATWRTAAHDLQEGLSHSEAFLTICGRIKLCDWQAALSQWVSDQTALTGDELAVGLRVAGVDVRASGLLRRSFGQPDITWWVVRSPQTTQRELWLVTQRGGQWIARRVATVAVDRPLLVFSLDAVAGDLYMVDGDEGQLLFSPRTDTPTGLLVVERALHEPNDAAETSDSPFDLDIRTVRDALLTGRDPAQVREALAAIRAQMTCPGVPSCATLDYWMGVASELVGDERGATESYVTAWSEAPDKLQAIWIRLKVEPVP